MRVPGADAGRGEGIRADAEERVMQAAEDAFTKVMAGVPEQLETMPPDLDLADAIRWFGDRVTELVASLSELPLETVLGIDGSFDRAREAPAATATAQSSEEQPAGEPVRVQARAGLVAETRVWVHPGGDLTPGVLQFLLSDLVSGSGESIPGSVGSFAPEQIATPVAAGTATLLRLTMPADAVPGCYHGHVFAHGTTGAAVPIMVNLT